MTTSTRTSSEVPAELIQQLEASTLRGAGLAGAYAEADCELGRRVLALLDAGSDVYLWGEPGRGKTYAAACAVRLWALRDVGRRSTASAHLVQVARMLADLRGDIDHGESWRMPWLESVPLLVMDDLGAERPTDWGVEQVSSLVDVRTYRGLRTVVTSNLPLGGLRKALAGLQGARIASRLSAFERVEVAGPDRRRR